MANCDEEEMSEANPWILSEVWDAAVKPLPHGEMETNGIIFHLVEFHDGEMEFFRCGCD